MGSVSGSMNCSSGFGLGEGISEKNKVDSDPKISSQHWDPLFRGMIQDGKKGMMYPFMLDRGSKVEGLGRVNCSRSQEGPKF